MIASIHQGLKDDGYCASISQLCRWFEIPQRTVYYRPMKKMPIVLERLAQPIKQLIEEHPSFGYRTVAHLLDFNKNTVQRIFQLRGWQVRKRPSACVHACRPCLRWLRRRTSAGPRICVASGVVAMAGPCLALVIDCCSRELLGWHLSGSGKSKTAESALEQALIASARCWA